MRLILFFLSFVISGAVHAESVSSETFNLEDASAQSRVKRLLISDAIHDGPNCFNAAAYSHGFVDTLAMVSSDELSFYLKKLCTKKTGEIQAGDILTVVSQRNLQHAVVAVDRDIILEKSSLSGRDGKYDPAWVKSHPMEYRYRTIRRKESRWFDGYSKDSVNSQIEVYRCGSVETAQKKLADLRKLPAMQIAERIKHRLQNIALREDPLNWNEQSLLRMDVMAFAKALAQLDGTQESHVYARTVANSIYQNMILLSMEAAFPADVELAHENLSKAESDLYQKILQANTRRLEANSNAAEIKVFLPSL
jgi:hypothetical protein